MTNTSDQISLITLNIEGATPEAIQELIDMLSSAVPEAVIYSHDVEIKNQI